MFGIIGLDPASVAGIAFLAVDDDFIVTDMYCTTITCQKLPPDADYLDAVVRGFWHQCRSKYSLHGFTKIHYIAETMFTGKNVSSVMKVERMSGQVYQVVGNCTKIETTAFYLPSKWRTILGKGVNSAKGDLGKNRAVELVSQRFNRDVNDHEAEAVCMALYRLRELEHEAKDLKLDIAIEKTKKPRKKA